MVAFIFLIAGVLLFLWSGRGRAVLTRGQWRVGAGLLSIGALVGLVTLFGIAARNTIMLISHYDHLVYSEGAHWNRFSAKGGIRERFTPIIMTALVTALGLLPLALGNGEAGREVEGPMAVVILGGLASSTLLNLLVVPALAHAWLRFTKSET